MNSRTPAQVLEELFALCPPFADRWAAIATQPRDLNLHHIMQEFARCFASHHRSLSPAQMRDLGEWIKKAVARHDDLENAVTNRFLVNARGLGVDGVLKPFVSRGVKRRFYV